MKNLKNSAAKILFLSLLLIQVLWTYGHDFETDSLFYKRQGRDNAWVTYNEYGKYVGHVKIPSEVSWQGKVYEVNGVTENAFSGSKKLLSVEMSNSVKTIGYYAFSRCVALTSVVMSESLTHIPECAFYECRKLMSINVPENVVSIGEMAFTGCLSLEAIMLPSTIKFLDNSAFFSCINLKSVVCQAVSVPTLGRAVFKNIPLDEATLYVPASALEDYKNSTQWKDFGTIRPIE